MNSLPLPSRLKGIETIQSELEGGYFRVWVYPYLPV